MYMTAMHLLSINKLVVVVGICCFAICYGARMPDWDRCNCHWDTWKSWNDCTETCYGYHYREREVWRYNTPSCQDVNKVCESGGSLDTGWYEWKDCNAQCPYGQVVGSGRYKDCQCPEGRYGTCCDHRVTCGAPPAVDNGVFSHSGPYHGDNVTYSCNPDYRLVGGTPTRTCMFGIWSGSSPKCLFAKTCRSNPCQNGATCEDMVEQYRCHCLPGWSGHNCELDVQPPVIRNCSDNITRLTSNKTMLITWSRPHFSDPHGFEVNVASNYDREEFEFPWGTFTVQYNAVKPSNGMTESCVFSIKVLPHPCEPLPVPQRGMVVCNGWQRELGQFCLASCLDGVYLPMDQNPATWHVCGATGHWSLGIPLDLKCQDKTVTDVRTVLPQPTSCSDTEGLGLVASTYVNVIKASNFSSFCLEWPNLCTSQNVNVNCID